jgi:hypothetical protein
MRSAAGRRAGQHKEPMRTRYRAKFMQKQGGPPPHPPLLASKKVGSKASG